jgi:hypothetical protein
LGLTPLLVAVALPLVLALEVAAFLPPRFIRNAIDTFYTLTLLVLLYYYYYTVLLSPSGVSVVSALLRLASLFLL